MKTAEKLRKQKDARKAHGNTQCEHLVTCKYQSVKWNRGYVTHGIEATCASPNGIEAKCASPRWRPNPEIDWHRDRYPRDMINPAGRNHVNRQRSPSSNANRSQTCCCMTYGLISLIKPFGNEGYCSVKQVKETTFASTCFVWLRSKLPRKVVSMMLRINMFRS